MSEIMITLIVGTNSYCSLDEANSYHETRFGNVLWEDQDDEEKVKALVGACNLLETINWFGDKSVYNQNLEWPRINSYQRTFYKSQPLLQDVNHPFAPVEVSETPKDIKYAQAELAFQLLKGYLANSSVTNLRVGSLQISTNNTGMFPLEVQNLINAYICHQPRLIRT
jgi:hypothetical protein